MLPSFQWRTRFQLIQAWLQLRLSGKHRPIDQIRERWGKEGTKTPWLATKLFDLTRESAAESVDDGTWRDLECERLFSSMDSTLTPLGSQSLYRKLRIYRDGRRIRLVAWRTRKAVYWVSNTLTQSLTGPQMLGIAASLRRLGKGKN